MRKDTETKTPFGQHVLDFSVKFKNTLLFLFKNKIRVTRTYRVELLFLESDTTIVRDIRLLKSLPLLTRLVYKNFLNRNDYILARIMGWKQDLWVSKVLLRDNWQITRNGSLSPLGLWRRVPRLGPQMTHLNESDRMSVLCGIIWFLYPTSFHGE